MRCLVLVAGMLTACSDSLPGVAVDDAAGPDAQDAMAMPGSVDGGDAAESSLRETNAGTWCETRLPAASFCDDFDRGELGARWDFFLMSPPGTAAIDATESKSAPSSLAVLTRMAPTDKPTIRVGVMAVGPALPYALRFDNVTLDISP